MKDSSSTEIVADEIFSGTWYLVAIPGNSFGLCIAYMGDFSWAAQSRDTTSTLDIFSTIGNLEVNEGNARLFGKISYQ